jgi:protein-disulfide isomerase
LVTQCGKLAKADEAHGALLELRGPHAQRSAVFFEDPLCPTCKSLHERLAASHVLDRLNIELALFPLDNDCNWMLDQPMHPGACQVSRAVLCADSPGQMLDWAYRNQELLAEAGKRGMSPGDTTNQAGVELIRRVFEKRFGNELVTCMGSKATTQQLNRHLHFAVDNAIAVSTPQVFIDGQRLCDEDIDIGLMFALSKLAPGLLD